MTDGPRPSRRRAAVFALLAAFCAVLSAAAAARRDADASGDLGELRRVVVVDRAIDRGSRITPHLAANALTIRELPGRFLPPDGLDDPSLALGSRAVGDIPAGSYLLASLLRRAGAEPPGQPSVGKGLRPVEVVVSGGPGGAVGMPAPGSRVDVLAADEPGSTSNPRVRVLARGVPLVSLEPLRDDALADPAAGSPPASWLATLALDRRRSLAVIEADNYAREVRLLAR
jgi:Flp pilus assembly protein CpaB